MIEWSVSTSRTFTACQRQWFFRSVFAHATAHDPLRREAYLLSKLKSVFAWRGDIVDHTIEAKVVPALRSGWNLNPKQVVDHAKANFDHQFAGGVRHAIREPGVAISGAGTEFAAFRDVEYGLRIEEPLKERAWADVEQALTNLLAMRDLLGRLRCTVLIPQRALTFAHYRATVKAMPDLISFSEDRPPLIVDWKVHTFGRQDYRFQLACYAIALTSCSPHKDFPSSLGAYGPTDIRLIEAQLLTAKQREYTLTDSDVDDVSAYICRSVDKMILAQGDSPENGRPFDLPAANYPETCRSCNYQRLCWEDAKWQHWEQMSLL